MAAKKPVTEWSDGEIADRWGVLKARGDDAADEIETLKTEFVRRGLDWAKGDKFKVVKDVGSQERFDVKAARAELGASAAKFVKSLPIVKYFVRPVEGAA